MTIRSQPREMNLNCLEWKSRGVMGDARGTSKDWRWQAIVNMVDTANGRLAVISERR